MTEREKAHHAGSQEMLAAILRTIDARADDPSAPELMRYAASLIADEIRILYGEPTAERPIGIMYAKLPPAGDSGHE